MLNVRFIGKNNKYAKRQQARGEDTFGNQYDNIDDFVKRELDPNVKLPPEEEAKIPGRIGSLNNWYDGQVKYWDVHIMQLIIQTQAATVNGVLGGYE